MKQKVNHHRSDSRQNQVARFALKSLALFTFALLPSLAQDLPGKMPDIGVTEGERELLQVMENSKFLESQITRKDWDTIVGQFQESYTIQPGDNLWDISSRLFGSGFYWPKIWAINNREIQNPHIIEPNQVLSFRASATEPPQMEIYDSPTSAPPKEQIASTEPVPMKRTLLRYPEIESPPRSKEWKSYTPPNSDLFNFLEDGVDQIQKLEAPEDSRQVIDQSFNNRSFMSAFPIETIGELVASPNPSIMLQKDDMVYLKLDKEYPKGTLLTVYENKGRIEAELSDRKGFAYEVLGDVEVDSTKEGFVLCKLKTELDVVKRGAKITPYIPILPKPAPVPNDKRIEAVIMSTIDLSQGNLGYGDFAYLDRGLIDDVKRGNIFQVYVSTDIDNKIELTFEESTLIAELLVWDVKDRFSTALVIMAKDFIPKGSIAITKGHAQFIDPSTLPPPPEKAVEGIEGELKTDNPVGSEGPSLSVPKLKQNELQELEDLSKSAGYPQGKQGDAEELNELDSLEDLDPKTPPDTQKTELNELDSLEELNELDPSTSSPQAKKPIAAPPSFQNPELESLEPIENLGGLQDLDPNAEMTSPEKPSLEGTSEYQEIEKQLSPVDPNAGDKAAKGSSSPDEAPLNEEPSIEDLDQYLE